MRPYSEPIQVKGQCFANKVPIQKKKFGFAAAVNSVVVAVIRKAFAVDVVVSCHYILLLDSFFSLLTLLVFQAIKLRYCRRCYFCYCGHRIEINRKASRVGTFEVCVSTHVSLRMFIMQVLASQLPFLANRNAELAVPPLFWPDNCIKVGGHVAMLSGPTVYTLYCAVVLLLI